MENETQTASNVSPEAQSVQSVPVVGTSQNGQSSDQQNKPNDGELMRADYTRKTQEVADMRRQLEAERQQLEAQRQQILNQQRQSQTQTQNPQDNYQQLVNVFGQEAAQVMWQSQQAVAQQNQHTQIELYRLQEELKGRQKYGDAWDKHNYTDPMTGQVKNKVMDLRMAINPFNGQALTLDQAFAAAEIQDVSSYRSQTEQSIRDKVYQEVLQKKESVPASNVAQPRSTGTGQASSVKEALEQSLAELGVNLA